jgi:hypothetical protein
MVVLPGVMTRSLNASSIIAQAVLCSFRYHSNCTGTLLATNSTATIGTDTNFEVHFPPRWLEREESSPLWRPLLKEISGSTFMAIVERVLSGEGGVKLAIDDGSIVDPVRRVSIVRAEASFRSRERRRHLNSQDTRVKEP